MRILLATILFASSATFAVAADMTATLPLRQPAAITAHRTGDGALRVDCSFDKDYLATLDNDGVLPSITRWALVSEGSEVSVSSLSAVTSPHLAEEYVANAAFTLPSSAISIGEPIPMGENQLIPVSFHPTVMGDAEALSVASLSAELRIESSSPPRIRRVIREMLGDLLINRDDVRRDQSDEAAVGFYVYVIPNSNAVREALAPLILLRRQQGYTVRELVAPEQEGAEWVYQQLVNINRAGSPIDYVLLAGDFGGEFSVPALTRGVESDYYYSLLEGRDNIPDAAVGRISYNSIAELERIVAKIINYETNFDAQNQAWLRKAAIATGHQASGFSTNLLGQWLRDYYLAHGYNQVDTLWYSMNQSVARFMQDSFEEGMMFVNFRGWSGMDDWSPEQAEDLRNQKLPVALLLACNTGDYAGAGAGYTEALLRAQGGAIGAVGIAGAQSRINFNNVLMAGYYRGVLDDGVYRLGWTVNRARMELSAIYGANAWELTLDHNSWLNLMGDPATVLWMGTPREVRIDAPQAIDAGLGRVQVQVTYAEGGQVAAGVRVGLYREDEINAGSITDNEGRAVISFAPRLVTQGNARITVSGDRIVQSSTEIQMNPPQRQVAVHSFNILDDQVEPRNGNSNGVVNPLETIQINLRVINFGAQILNPAIRFDLLSLSEYVEVIEGGIDFQQQMQPNTPTQIQFLIRTAANFPDRTPVPLRLRTRAGAGDWASDFTLYGEAPRWELVQILAEDMPAPGDADFPFGLLVVNSGSVPLGISQVILRSHNEDAEVTFADAEFDSIAVGDFGTTGNRAFGVTFSGDIAYASDVEFSVAMTSEDGYRGNFDFTLKMADPPGAELTGPDEYGYYAIDDRDRSSNLAPVYSWIELNPRQGGRGVDTGILDQGEDEDQSVYQPLPFTFRYYGVDYNGVTICSNGWIAMGDQRNYVDFRNLPIGSPQGPRAQICPLWDDLYQPGGDATVFSHYNPALHQFVIEWFGMRGYVGPQAQGPTATFEVILNDPAWYPTTTGDGDITFQYSEVQANARADANSTPYATVGIGDPTDRGGLQLGFWNNWAPGSSQPANGTAIRFSTARGHSYAIAKGSINRANNNDPIAGATVRSTRGGWTVTDDQGQYRIPIILADLPFRLVASAPGFNTTTSDEISIRVGDSTTVALQLRAPQITVEPAEISDSLQAGEEVSTPFTIRNAGDGELSFQVNVDLQAEQGLTLLSQEARLDRDNPDEPFQSLLHWNVSDSTDDNRILGVAYDGERFFVSGGSNGEGENKIYLFSQIGYFLGELEQPVQDLWGLHDLAWDGQNLYGGSGEFIYKLDVQGREVAQIANPVIPPRALAVTPGGAQIWIGNETHNITCIDPNGTVLASYEHNLHPYGFAWHPADPDQAPLWIFSMDGPTNMVVSKLDTATGVILPVAQLEFADGDRPGGCDLTMTWDDHRWAFVAVIQNPAGDRIEVLDAGVNLAWLSCNPQEGTIASGGNREVSVTLNSTGLMGGDYSADIVIQHNAAGDEVRIPVTVYVEPNFAGVDDPAPGEYHLAKVYPNPSNGSVIIKFELPTSEVIQLRIYDRQGRLVETLYNGALKAGSHQTTFAREDLPSGLYFVKLSGSTLSQTRKFVLLR